MCIWGITYSDANTNKIQSEIDMYLDWLESQRGNNRLFKKEKEGVILVKFFLEEECAYIELARMREYRDRRRYIMKEYQNHMNRKGYTVLLDNNIVDSLNAALYNKITEFQMDSILRVKLPNVEENPLIIFKSDNSRNLVKICRDSIIRKPLYFPIKENVQKMKWEDFWKNRKY